MLIIQRPEVEAGEPEGNIQSFVIGPLEPGFGHTLGNSLRRTLLSSIPGAAVTQVRFDEALHEFDTIPGVKEDVTDLILNVKDVVLRCSAEEPVTLRLDKRGPGDVVAADIQTTADVEILNPDLHVATINAKGRLAVDLTVEQGRGYLSAERNKRTATIGVIPVDAIFSPVRKVNYWVENTRVGQMTNYDKLTLEIETDGTMSPEEALSRAAEILVGQFSLFTSTGKTLIGADRGMAGTPALPPNMLDMPIEELDLPMRAYNSLKRNNIVKVGQLLQLQDEDLLRMRNFGKKSLDEMKERLRMRGFLPPDDGSDGSSYDEDELAEADDEEA
jgi:DNA-directed RNA polymerase subunit alpha